MKNWLFILLNLFVFSTEAWSVTQCDQDFLKGKVRVGEIKRVTEVLDIYHDGPLCLLGEGTSGKSSSMKCKFLSERGAEVGDEILGYNGYKCIDIGHAPGQIYGWILTFMPVKNISEAWPSCHTTHIGCKAGSINYSQKLRKRKM